MPSLSLVFVHDVAPHPEKVPLLAASWTFFAVSLLVILVSYLTSQAGLHREITAFDDGEVLPTPGGTPGKVTFALNIAGTFALIAGVACFVVFAILNV